MIAMSNFTGPMFTFADVVVVVVGMLTFAMVAAFIKRPKVQNTGLELAQSVLKELTTEELLQHHKDFVAQYTELKKCGFQQSDPIMEAVFQQMMAIQVVLNGGKPLHEQVHATMNLAALQQKIKLDILEMLPAQTEGIVQRVLNQRGIKHA